MVLNRPRVDAHIHIDPIDPCCVHHATPPPTVPELGEYIDREKLGAVYAIYESAESLGRFSTLPATLVPLFWLRDISRPVVPDKARGIKLHPYLDKWVVSLDALAPVLELARRRGLFLFIHTEDREPEFSRPCHAAKLAEAYPDVPIVLAHAGSYAPPGRVRLKPLYRRRLLDRTRRLVREAVEVACTFRNVFLETSILYSPTKARILAGAPASKLLIGTDFPILSRSRPQLQALSFQEEQLLRFGMDEKQIRTIHRNARKLAGL